MKYFLTILILFFAFQGSFGQEVDFSKNWFWEIKGIDDYYTSYDFRRYTKDDVVKAKARFNLIKQFPPENEWEGAYMSNTEIGASELHWSSKGGFVDYYVYHTLASLDFGGVRDRLDSVVLLSEKSPIFKRETRLSNTLVKIKLGEMHYLVPENRVQDFAARAVGLDTSLSDFGYYWWKGEYSEQKAGGLPVLPQRYKRFFRFPINTKIVQVGKREINQIKFDDGTINYEEIYRFVTLDAGADKKIKIGMNFFVRDLDEWIEIIKVAPKSSIGKIRRWFNENNQEDCRDEAGGQGQPTPCKEIKVGMKAETKRHFF